MRDYRAGKNNRYLCDAVRLPGERTSFDAYIAQESLCAAGAFVHLHLRLSFAQESSFKITPRYF